MAVPYTFATATSSIPLSQLDSNFATGITLGNTTVYLGNTTTSFGNVTLTNVTISNVATTFPNSFLSYSSVTLGTTNVSLGGTATTLANVSLSNVTISSVASAITVSEGGTGLTTLTTGYIPYGNGTSAFSSSANLTFNGTLLNVTGNINSTNSCTLARTDGQLLVVGDQTSGGAKLDVQTASGTASNLRLYQQGVSNFTISVPASTDALTFSSYAGERMRISSAGYLGIGTSSPANTLHVLSSVGTNTYFQSSATAVYLKFGNSLATDGFIGYESTGGNQMTFYTANTEKMRLDSSGNLGLGVTPSAWGVGSGGHAFELAGGNSIWSYSSSSGFNFSQNLYYNGAYYYKTTNGASSYGQYNGVHYWYNAPSGAAGTTFALTQAMTLDNSGNLLVGTTTASGKLRVQQSANSFSGLFENTLSSGFSNEIVSVRPTQNTTNGSFYAYSYYNNTAAAYKFYVIDSGAIYSTSIVITAISDQRLKENIRDLDTGLSTVMALKPRRFDWKEGKGQDKKNAAGFIAQEFQEVLPNSISTFKAGEDGIDYLTMNHEELIPTLVKAIQEQQAIIEQLKAKVGI